MASDTSISSATFESRLTTLETNFAVFVQEMKDFKEEMKDFKNETRQQNAMRANEIAEIRQAIQSMQNQNIFVIIGVVAIAVAVFLK